MSAYSDGRRVEYAVIHDMRANGYETIRGASSKGICDVLCIKHGQVLLISCKRTKPPGPAERTDLLRVVAMIPSVGIPLVALKPKGKPLTYRRLLGIEADGWIPWSPDLVAS